MLDELEIQADQKYAELHGLGELRAHPGRRRTSRRSPRPYRVHRPGPRLTSDRFGQAGVDSGLTADDGPAGPRPDYPDDYYAASLQDADGNSFEAVHRDGKRPLGNIDHLALSVSDLDASTTFYLTIADQVGLTIARQTADRAEFALDEANAAFIVIAGEPTPRTSTSPSPGGDDDDVRRFHGDATAAGYRSNGEPGERPRYHDGYYAAYVLDPDGNNIEVVNHHDRSAA